MEGKKATKGKQAPRGKTEANKKRHAALCLVCKHSQRQEIERGYLAFNSVPQLAETFGVSDDSIYRHAEYLALDERRAFDTEKVLQNVIARGFAQHKNIDPKTAMTAVQELNKMQGKLKAPETHPADVERAKREQVKEWLQEQGLLESHANN